MCVCVCVCVYVFLFDSFIKYFSPKIITSFAKSNVFAENVCRIGMYFPLQTFLI